MEFNNPVDIGNRAAQHCGARQMSQTLGFNDPNSKTATEIGFAYPKLRRAELQRNTWRFAIRKAVLRAIDPNTLILSAAMWVGSTTYFRGSIVSDATGNLWQSRQPNNLGNQPGVTSAWEPYFGPQTVSLYDSSQSYYAGELVYTAAGDGTSNTFMSLITGNAVHPAVPNQWSATTTYFANQVVQQFPAWAVGTTYAQGAGVVYTDGLTYVSLTAGNVGHIPPSSSTQWALMPTLTLTTPQVPATTSFPQFPTSSPISEWQSGTTYALGNFAMFNATTWVSLAGNNTGNLPNASASTFWAAVTGGTLSMSLTNLNIGNSPATTTVAAWAVGTTYASGNKVTGSNGVIYTSVGNGNVGNDPTLDLTGTNWTNTGVLSPWTTVFTQGGGNPLWLQIGGASFPTGVGVAVPDIVYPAGSGPVTQSGTLNVFMLPAGFLRRAPRDPKAGIDPWLGSPAGLFDDDWRFENQFLISRTFGPLMLRFVADVTDVRLMNDMFCEGLAARIALAVMEPLTQSTEKKAQVDGVYKFFMGEARTINAIEVGSEEPPIDELIAVRL